jgi:hypothetical protein
MFHFEQHRGKYIDYIPVPVPESDPSGLTMLYWTAAALFPVCLATLENLQKKIFIGKLFLSSK